MIRRIMLWLSGLSLRYKVVYTLLVLIWLVIFPEVIAHLLEWSILLENLLDWFTNYSSVLLRLLTFVVALFFLYGIYLSDKSSTFFRKLTFNELRRHRFLIILLVGICESFLVFYFWDNLRKNIEAIGGENPNWLGPFFTMAVAAPIAFFIWSFRNNDKRKDLQHTEENIRQADFHKIEEWATTFPIFTLQKTDPTTEESQTISKITSNETETRICSNKNNSTKHKVNDSKGSTLQVAAIYQLLPYIKGEYGERFMRPAMEIYRSLLFT